MLLNLFDGHPKCCVYPSDLCVLYGYFPKYIIEKHTADARLKRLDLVIFSSLKRLRDRRNLGDLLPVELMREHFFSHLDHACLDQIDVIIRQIIASYRFVTNQTQKEKPYVLVKETSLEIYAQELAAVFPDSKFIPLIRDPRDNYGALRAGVDKHYSKFGESEKHILASLIHRAGLSMRLMDANIQALGKERFRPVVFEQLVTDTRRVLSDVLDFLDLEWNNCLLRPTVMGQETTGNNYDDEKFREVTNKNVGRWRERISEFEAQVIEYHLADVMKKHGYNLAFSPLESAKSASEFYKWTNTRYFFNDSFSKLY
jgi:hypothetical protein